MNGALICIASLPRFHQIMGAKVQEVLLDAVFARLKKKSVIVLGNMASKHRSGLQDSLRHQRFGGEIAKEQLISALLG